MSMSKIEKNILIVFAAVFVLFIGSCRYTVVSINEAGGLKQLIIDAGKDIKEISKAIDEE